MPHFSLPELMIVLVIVVVLFGAGRVSKVGGELGIAIREFRKGLNGGESTTVPETAEKIKSELPPPTVDERRF